MITKLQPNEIFVFGSNLAGRHGKGAALTARQKFGAIYGQGIGLQGQSYGIPTKDKKLNILPLDVIQLHVTNFIKFAKNNQKLTFLVTPIGCGLAGYKTEQIAPLFQEIPKNIKLPKFF